MFTGSLVAIVTPFKNGKLDERALGDLIEWQISSGTHGIVPCGTTGESATLRFVGTEFQIWAEVNGASRSMALIAPSTSGISMYAGGSSAVNRIVNISSAGLMFPNDNTHDIGASGATRPKTGYFGTRVVSPEFQTTTALVALGGGAGATLGTIGGSGPATAGQNTWLRMVDSTGAAFWVPAWK